MSELWINYRSILYSSILLHQFCLYADRCHLSFLIFLCPNGNIARVHERGEAVPACCCLPTGEVEQWLCWTYCIPDLLCQRALGAFTHPWLALNFPCREGRASSFWDKLTRSVLKCDGPCIPHCSVPVCLAQKNYFWILLWKQNIFWFLEPFSDLFDFLNRLDFGVKLSKRPALFSISIYYFPSSQVLRSCTLLVSFLR